jgi:lysyl-tRNA synthetase class 2
MLELYFANAGYLDLVPLVETLVAAAAAGVGVPAPSWRRRTVAELFGGAIPADDATFFLHWVDVIEPALVEPTFVLDYPARHAALAEVRGDVAERLEVYLGGLELGNGFSELRDPEELRARFLRSASHRTAMGRIPHPVDEGVIAASGQMPRAAGIAIGVDRLVMALTGEPDIARVQVPR